MMQHQCEPSGLKAFHAVLTDVSCPHINHVKITHQHGCMCVWSRDTCQDKNNSTPESFSPLFIRGDLLKEEG